MSIYLVISMLIITCLGIFSLSFGDLSIQVYTNNLKFRQGMMIWRQRLGLKVHKGRKNQRVCQINWWSIWFSVIWVAFSMVLTFMVLAYIVNLFHHTKEVLPLPKYRALNLYLYVALKIWYTKHHFKMAYVMCQYHLAKAEAEEILIIF